MHNVDVGVDRRVEGPGEACGVGHEDQSGRQQPEHVPEGGEVGGHERVGRRDRRIGHADVLRRERQEQVLNAIARENRERPFHR